MDAQNQIQLADKADNRIELPEEMVLAITKCLPRADLARFLRASRQALRIGHPVLYTLSVDDSLLTFSWACRAQMDSVIDYLLPGILAANEDDPKIGYQALIYAAKNGRTEVVRQLLAHKVVLDKPEMGLSPLTFAVREDHADVARLLIAGGVDLSSVDQNSPHDWNIETLQINTRERILHSAVAWGSVEVLNMLLATDLGLDIDALDALGLTALCKAAENGDRALVQILISHGANLNAAGIIGCTPLHYAVHGPHTSIVEILLSAGADPGARGPDGAYPPPPLLTAAIESHTEIARLLLDHGADIEDKFDARGRTALSVAVDFARQSAILDLFLSRNADINTQCALGITPISYAAGCGNMFAVRKLLAAGCDLRPDHHGRTTEYFIVNNPALCGTPSAKELLDLLGKARKTRAGLAPPPNSAPPS
jgi:cytohesin